MSGKILFFVLGTGALFGFFAPQPDTNDAQPLANMAASKQALAKPPPPPQTAGNGFATTINRESDGHFYATVQVNNQPVRFLIDTGASAVALTSADARRIGLIFDRSEFQPIGRGASGEVMGMPVSLDTMELDGKRATQVRGAILDDGLDVSLLGQTFLSQLSSVSISGDRLEIK